MATPKDRAHGWIGSKFVGIPAATGQAAPQTVNTSQSGDWFASNGFQPSQPQGGQQTASVGQPAPAIEGYNMAKLADPSQGTTAKYIAGRYLQAHPGDYQGLVQQPGMEGWTSSGEKITSPQGSVYDLARDATGKNGQPGANVQQFTYVGGGPAGVRNTGIKGDDPNSANYTKPGGLGYKGTAPAPPGTAAYVAQQGGGQASMPGPMVNSSGMAMPTAPTVTNLAAPSPFTYQTNTQGAFNAPSMTPEMAQQSYNAMASPDSMTAQQQATPAALSYENLATPEGYTPEAYQGMTAEQLQSDPSYQFRLKAGQDALENTLARTGSLRGGNAANALMAQGQGMASQEYAAADARARATNAMNNATSLGAYQTNAQTGLAYNQNVNQNALNFGQANIQNAYNAIQANNAANLAYGNQNFQNQFAVNQANNQGSNAAIAANNASALAQQGQQYGQSLGAYQTNQAAQNQAYQQALGAYGLNAQTGLSYGSQNQQNELANYQARVNAALGVGNLNLGYTQAGNQYALGQGNLDLQRSGQAFNQANQTWENNYRANVLDPWSQNYQLASLGNPGAPNSQGYGQQQADIYGQQGNAASAGQIAQGNAWSGAVGNLGNLAQDYALNRTAPTNQQPRYQMGQGQPLWAY